jgi:hypothetical protein
LIMMLKDKSTIFSIRREIRKRQRRKRTRKVVFLRKLLTIWKIHKKLTSLKKSSILTTNPR